VRSTALHKYGWIDFVKIQSIDDVEVDGVELNAERVIKPLQLWYALLERHLSTFETTGNRVTGVLTLGTTTCGLATFTADTTTDALWFFS
jgi:hypothetical protein